MQKAPHTDLSNKSISLFQVQYLSGRTIVCEKEIKIPVRFRSMADAQNDQAKLSRLLQ